MKIQANQLRHRQETIRPVQKNDKKHTTTEPKSSAEQEEAAAQERAKPLSQEGGRAQEDGAQEDVETKATDSTPPAPTAPAEEHTNADLKSTTKQASATANRQEETGQVTKVAQSSAGTQNSDRPTFMTNDNFGCPDDVLKKIVADEYKLYNLEKTKPGKYYATQIRAPFGFEYRIGNKKAHFKLLFLSFQFLELIKRSKNCFRISYKIHGHRILLCFAETDRLPAQKFCFSISEKF